MNYAILSQPELLISHQLSSIAIAIAAADLPESLEQKLASDLFLFSLFCSCSVDIHVSITHLRKCVSVHLLA